MVVVDDLDEWLDLAALGLASLRHTAGDGKWVALDTGDQGVRVWVRLVASILGLDDHDLVCLSISISLPLPNRTQFIHSNAVRPSKYKHRFRCDQVGCGK